MTGDTNTDAAAKPSLAGAADGFAVHRQHDVLRLTMPQCDPMLFASLASTLDCTDRLYPLGTNAPLAAPDLLLTDVSGVLTSADHGSQTLAAALGELRCDDGSLVFVRENRATATLYTRDPLLLRAALHLYVDAVLEGLIPSPMRPQLDERSVSALTEPVPEGAWTELNVSQTSETVRCDVTTRNPRTVVSETTWLGRPGSAWRTDWSW